MGILGLKAWKDFLNRSAYVIQGLTLLLVSCWLLFEFFIVGDPLIMLLQGLLIGNAFLGLSWALFSKTARRSFRRKFAHSAVSAVFYFLLLFRMIDPLQSANGIPRSAKPVLSELSVVPGKSLCYCLNGLEWAEWLWRVELEGSDFDVLSDALAFRAVEAPTNGSGFSMDLHPFTPIWWAPPLGGESETFAFTGPMEYTGYSWQGLVVWDAKSKVMYMQIMDIISYRGKRYPVDPPL